MERQFAFAIKEIEKDTANFYRRFAVNNDISLSEAKRLLNTKELAEFRWTVQDYIRYGEVNAISGNWKKQLENASARVHIARYDSLKLQIQHQAEILYANQLDSIDDLAKSIYYDSYYHTAFEIQKGFGVGYALMDVNSSVIEKVLSKPWTADDRTFRDRCWVNKEDLVNSVNTHLTQMIIRGESPDKTIAAIAKDFNVSKAKAGRIVMTEGAAFASAGQRDCYNALGVEEFVVVETLDLLTCEVCSAMDDKVFKHSDFKIGVTVPPFHPNCRGTTAPYFNDEFEDGTRFARGVDGKGYQVDGNMTYDEWRKRFTNKQSGDIIVIEDISQFNGENTLLGRKKERAIIYDTAGNEIMRRDGDVSSVRFTKEEISAMKGHILSHNHPSNGPLSPRDLHNLITYGLAEVRAVTNHGVFSIKRPDNYGLEVDYIKLTKSFWTQLDNVSTRMHKRVSAGSVPIEQAEYLAQVISMRRLSRTYGLRMELIRWK